MRVGGNAAWRATPGAEPSQAPRPAVPPPRGGAAATAGAPRKRAGLPRAEPPAAPPAVGRAARLAAPEASGRARERSASPRVTSRHPAPPASQGPASRPARRRTVAFRVRPFSRFEFPPAKRERQNTRMVIAGLFAPIL